MIIENKNSITSKEQSNHIFDKKDKNTILNSPLLKQILGNREILSVENKGSFNEQGEIGTKYLITTNDPNFSIIAKVIRLRGPIPLKDVEFQVQEISTKATGFFPNWNPAHATDLRA